MNLTFTTSDSFLIESCIKGNRRSQKELYDRYASKMFLVCIRYTKDEMDAEDVLQEGFIKLFNNLHMFRGEGSFEGWVRRIFVNVSIEHLRRKHTSTVSTDVVSIKDNYKNGLDNLYEKDLLSTTNILSDGYKKVFQLYAIEGYSHKEISGMLGITESTSKSQFCRAKTTLRSVLSPINCNSHLVA